MDSYTQALLGAAVGEAVLGKKVGNRAPIWGAVAGIIPDLDVYFPPNQPALQWVLLHRGWSHSILFAIVAGIAFGFILSKIYKNQPAGWKDWSWLMFLGLFTHALLDCLTVFGTQIFWPFWDYRVEIGSIAFRDFIYSGILLVSVIGVFFINKKRKLRRYLMIAGLGLSCLYLAFAGINKLIADAAFKEALQEQNISYERLRSGPQIYTSWKWYGLIETKDGFYTSYYFIFNPQSEVILEFIPKNEALLSELEGTKEFKRMYWFTSGYYFAEKEGDTLYMHDLRFGNPAFGTDTDINDARFVFSFQIEPQENDLKVSFAGRD